MTEEEKKQIVRLLIPVEWLGVAVTVSNDFEIEEAMATVRKIFPGCEVETLNAPMAVAGTDESVKRNDNGESKEDLGKLVLKSPPYVGKRLSDLSEAEIRMWVRMDRETLHHQDLWVIEQYLLL